jgi:hypothetical protein
MAQEAAMQRLARAAERVERWRRTRAKQSPMPAHLWEEAVALARQLGVHPVKAALRLNYESLRQRLERAGAASADFVELTGAQLLESPTAGPVVEISDPGGHRLTVRLPPGAVLDVARLVEAFRGRSS